MQDLPKTQHFIVFQEVVRCGSIRAASRSLGVTQPAITRTIHDIENYFDTELIIRNNTGVELTEAGKLLLSHSRIILKDISHSVTEMRRLLEHTSAEVAFGYSSLIGFTILPEITKNFLNCYPGAKISIQEGQLSTLLPALREGHLDFAIGSVTPDMPIQNMIVHPLFNAEFAFVAEKKHPLAQCETLQALTRARWVLPQTDMGYYQALFELFEHNVVNTDRVVRTDSVITIYNLVAHAEFLSVLAKAMSTPFNNENFIELPIREHLPLARYALVYPKNRRVGNETEAIINLVKNHPYHLYRGLNPIT
ncbi:transcriptional regulator TdcA [Shigella flexneri]|nr:transcriptional regulator TdcA [Escherichia coli]